MKNYTYPHLHKILKQYQSQKSNFQHTYVLACQHILTPQAQMFKMMHEFGIPKENIHIFGKVYSTNKIVLQDLMDYGFNVVEHEFNQGVHFDIQHSENCKIEFFTFMKNIKPGSRIIILDDGGEVLKTVHDNFHIIPKGIPVFGVEQTSSGFRKLEHSNLQFPIYNVARSNLKLRKESPFIAQIGHNRIISVFNYYSIDPRILIVGQGPIGQNLFSKLKNKYNTKTFDITTHKDTDLVEYILEHNINVIIGATGKNILNAEKLEKINTVIKHRLYLISISSTDREFDVTYFRNKTKNLSIHSDILQRNMVLINNGFPITFKGNPYESHPAEIEKTIGSLYRSVLESVVTDEKRKGFIDIPVKIKFSKSKNQIQTKLLAYSESISGKQIATFSIKIPKFVWGHLISHRSLSRNSASSRAIPARRIRKSVLQNPFLPIYFGENKPGMQSGLELKGFKLAIAKKIWLWSRYIPVLFHFLGEKIGIHKETINRLLEPWLMVDIIVTGTEWKNFIRLRTNEAAQPEIRIIAKQIDEILKDEIPEKLKPGQWHIPFILDSEKNIDLSTKKKISVARCARVSYSLFDEKLSDIASDLKLYKKLSSSGHWSPFEHIAQALDNNERIANFVGWKQFRKEFENENGGDYV